MNDDDIEIYLKNRYFDTSRLYNNPFEKHQKIANVKHQQQMFKSIKPSTSVNEKNINKATQDEHPPSAMNEPNQEKVFIIEDSNNNFIGDEGDDEDPRLFYNLMRDRLYKDI